MKRIVNEAVLKAARLRPCDACKSNYLVEAHHIKTKGAWGGDIPENILSLCQRCHTGAGSVHEKGLTFLVRNFPHLDRVLKSKGWELDSFAGRYIRCTEGESKR